MNYIRRGAGKPLLLIHGLGGSWKSWNPILDGLRREREVIAVDLPGFGETVQLNGETSIRSLADAVTKFVYENNLNGADAVGSSMGARLVLELARRGDVLGAVVSLDPGGFWQSWQRHFFFGSVFASIRLIKLLQPVMPMITGSALGRTLLFAQFSAHPWNLSPLVALDEMRSFAASPVADELLYNLAYGEEQQGAPIGSIKQPIVIGWGRYDRVCFPNQAERALELFPDARLHWFENSGHFPQWDSPREATQMILEVTSGSKVNGAVSASAA